MPSAKKSAALLLGVLSPPSTGAFAVPDPPRPTSPSPSAEPATERSATKGKLRGWDVERYQSRHGFVWEHGSSLVDLLDVRRGERILDVGCGSGELTNAIAESADDVDAIGVDSDAGMVERAREQFPRVNFFQGNVQDFQLKEPVDAVFSNAALHWVPPSGVDSSVASMARALKSGGRFVVEFGGKGNVQRIVEATQEAIPGTESPWYFPSVAEYASVLERNGIEVLSATLYDRPTKLEDKEDGIKDWLRMFGSSFFKGMGEEEVDAALDRIQERVRPHLHDGTNWIADYRRIRIVGRKV